MKVPEKNKVKTQKIKKKPIDKNKKEQVLIVAQEFKFARLLSGNEKKTRDRVLKTLKKWLQNCFDKKYEFKEDDFVRVWKGLFYAVWMSDKPLVQEDLCESIAEILDLFPPHQLKDALMMTKAGLKVLALEWYGIDQHRMDKFFMLVRRYLRGSFRCLLRSNWSLQSCQMYSKMLMDSDGILCVKTPQYAKNALSLILHIIDCYLEELAKMSKGDIPEASLAALLHPFTSLVCGGEALVMCAAARRLLTALLRQSEPGLRYQEATRAWQKMGCPAGGPEALELVVSDDEEQNGENGDVTMEESSALDPRAGRVDVVLPLLPVPAALLADQLREMMAKASSKAYKRASICLQRFEALSKGEYPLALPTTETSGPEPRPPRSAPERSALQLRALEKNLVVQSDELALRGLKRKHRKRLLAKSRAGLSIMEDVAKLQTTQASSTNGGWQIEETEPVAERSKQEISSNKENVKKNANRKRKAQENGHEKVKKFKPDIKNKVGKTKLSTNNIVEKVTNGAKKELVNGVSKKVKNMKEKKKVKNAPKLITDKETNESKDLVEKTESTKTEVNKVKTLNTQEKTNNTNKKMNRQKVLPMSKIKNYQKQTSSDKSSPRKKLMETPKKVKFVLKNNSMQGTVDYYKSVRQSPNIPFDSSKVPSKTNLKPSTPSPINPFFKKKLRMKL